MEKLAPAEQQAEFIEFMSAASEDYLGIPLTDITETPEFKARVSEIEVGASEILLGSDMDEVVRASTVNFDIVSTLGTKLTDPEWPTAEEVIHNICKNPYETALIEFFGRALLAQVEDNLPYWMEIRADEWQGATPERRSEILNFLDRQILRYYTSRTAIDQSDEDGLKIYDEDAASPEVVSKIGDSINCLGIAVLLSAFAKRADADFLFVNQVMPSKLLYVEKRQEAWNSLNAMTAQMRIGISPELDALKTAHVAEAEGVMNSMLDFHHSIVIKVRDEDDRWAIVDPFMNNLLPFMSKRIRKTYEENRQDRLVNPGKAVLDADNASVFITEATVKFLRFFSSIEAVRFYNDAVEYFATNEDDADFDDFVDFVNGRQDIDLTTLDGELEDRAAEVEKMFGNKGVGGMPNALAVITKRYYDEAIEGVWPQKIFPDVKGMAKDIPYDFYLRFSKDEAFRRRFIEDMIGYQLHTTLLSQDQGWRAILRDNDRDPAFELGDPDFMIGAFVLNHLIAWKEYGRNSVSSVLSESSSSQLLWQQAMVDPDPEMTSHALGMERTLRSLSGLGMVHQHVEWQLSVLAKGRTNGNEGQNTKSDRIDRAL